MVFLINEGIIFIKFYDDYLLIEDFYLLHFLHAYEVSVLLHAHYSIVFFKKLSCTCLFMSYNSI